VVSSKDPKNSILTYLIKILLIEKMGALIGERELDSLSWTDPILEYLDERMKDIEDK